QRRPPLPALVPTRRRGAHRRGAPTTRLPLRGRHADELDRPGPRRREQGRRYRVRPRDSRDRKHTVARPRSYALGARAVLIAPLLIGCDPYARWPDPEATFPYGVPPEDDLEPYEVIRWETGDWDPSTDASSA